VVRGPWERVQEREPSCEQRSTWKRGDTGGEGPTRDRPTGDRPTQRGAPYNKGANPHNGRDPHRRHTDKRVTCCSRETQGVNPYTKKGIDRLSGVGASAGVCFLPWG